MKTPIRKLCTVLILAAALAVVPVSTAYAADGSAPGFLGPLTDWFHAAKSFFTGDARAEIDPDGVVIEPVPVLDPNAVNDGENEETGPQMDPTG